jgi:hypothetical protein
LACHAGGREFSPEADRPRHFNKKGAVFTGPFFCVLRRAMTLKNIDKEMLVK